MQKSPSLYKCRVTEKQNKTKQKQSSGVSVDCLAWSPVLDSNLAARVDSHQPLVLRSVEPAEFQFHLQHVSTALQGAMDSQERAFAQDIPGPAVEAILISALSALDSTQNKVVDTKVNKQHPGGKSQTH